MKTNIEAEDNGPCELIAIGQKIINETEKLNKLGFSFLSKKDQ
jgi:hypothetical protein